MLILPGFYLYASPWIISIVYVMFEEQGCDGFFWRNLGNLTEEVATKLFALTALSFYEYSNSVYGFSGGALSEADGFWLWYF